MAWPGLSDGTLARLVLCACWFTATAAAQEPFLARVLSIESERVTLTLEGSRGEGSEPLTVAIGAAGLPEGLVPGTLVRVWPGPAPGPEGLRAGARLVPLDREMKGEDRTGVRARLMYGAQRGFGGRPGGR